MFVCLLLEGMNCGHTQKAAGTVHRHKGTNQDRAKSGISVRIPRQLLLLFRDSHSEEHTWTVCGCVCVDVSMF